MLRLGRNDVLFGALVEPSHTLDGDVIGLGGPGREDDFLWIGLDEGGDLTPGCLDGLFGLPAVQMCSRVGVSVLLSQIREHGVQDSVGFDVDWPLSET